MKKMKYLILLTLLHLTHAAIAMEQGESSSKDLTSTRQGLDSDATLTIPNLDEMNLKYVKYLIEDHRPSLDDLEESDNPVERAAKLLKTDIESDWNPLGALINKYLLHELITEHKLPYENQGSNFYSFMRSHPPKDAEEVLSIFLRRNYYGQDNINCAIGKLFENKADERPARYDLRGSGKAEFKDFIFEDNRTFGDYFGWEYMNYYIAQRQKEVNSWSSGRYTVKTPALPARYIASRKTIKSLDDLILLTENETIHQLFNLSADFMIDPSENDIAVLNDKNKLENRFNQLILIAHPDKNSDTDQAKTVTQALNTFYDKIRETE